MINVKTTIFNTIKTTFDKMRLLGDYNPKLLKKILFLIVLDDIYDWSDYLDDKQSVQKRLQELRTNFILCNQEFDICRFPIDKYYVNVNTPQTHETWQRLWDDPNTEIINTVNPITPSVIPMPWAPDPTCNITVVYFSSSKETGEPELDPNTLTTCEKMNIYINRETSTVWYLDECGIWKKIDNGITSWTEDEILEVAKQLKVKHIQEDNSDIYAKLDKTAEDPIEFCNTEELVEDLV